MRKRYTAADRKRFLEEVRATGDSVRVVAERQGVNVSTAYLWSKASREEQPRVPRFAKLVKSQASSSVIVEVGAAKLRVEPGFDADLLRAVITALDGSRG
jgi:transposase-like protein